MQPHTAWRNYFQCFQSSMMNNLNSVHFAVDENQRDPRQVLNRRTPSIEMELEPQDELQVNGNARAQHISEAALRHRESSVTPNQGEQGKLSVHIHEMMMYDPCAFRPHYALHAKYRLRG